MMEWMLCNQNDDEPSIHVNDVIQCAQRFCPEVANNDQLFDQVVELNEMIVKITKKDNNVFTNLKTAERWAVLLKNKNIFLIAKIINVVFSIPCSNAFCERVFSLMNAQWTDERNRLHLETVTATLGVCINSNNIDCAQMADFLSKEDNIQQLLSTSLKYE